MWKGRGDSVYLAQEYGWFVCFEFQAQVVLTSSSSLIYDFVFI